jgi:hypothetical protein
MTSNKPLDRYLQQLHTYAQNIEETFRKAVEDTSQVGREAEAAQIDFEAFAESWAAMLLVSHELADEAGIDLAVFASSWADLLLTIRAKIASNKELAEIMQTSLTNKIGNAQLISINFDWLEEVTPGLIADKNMMIRSQPIMDDSLAELARRGEPATLRLHWMAEWLKKNGYLGESQ